MNLTVSAYARALRGLMPTGPAWIADAGSVIANLLLGVSEELARVDARVTNVVDESDPRTATELLTDWERAYGLPDPCLGTSPTTSQLRASLVAKIAATGGQTPAYFIAIALVLGFTITITEFRQTTVMSPVNTPLYDDYWALAWQVNGLTNTVHFWTVLDGVGDPLASWGNTVLECVLNELKPAHTTVFFVYS